MKEVIIKIECFNLKYTLECGQCFRWEKVDEDTYIGVIKDRVLKVRQKGDKLYVSSSNYDNLEEIIKRYFDLNTDYKCIESRISKIDENVYNTVKNTTGIRILNQDFFETLISYIISANNNIPRISKSIKAISMKYGKKVIFEDKEYYLFPNIHELENVSEEEFRECGVGFRAKYITNTIKYILDNKFLEQHLDNMTTEQLSKELMKMQGIGPKVSDCILLFSCGRKEVFPIDVWVERVMCMLYFDEKTIKKNDILNYAKNHFEEYAGIVQQHLFHNIREKMI